MWELKVVRERRAGYVPARAVSGSGDVYAAFKDRFGRMDREEFLVVLLDAKGRTMGFNIVSVGTLAASLVHPREVFKPAILGNAASVILLHNHPSGDPTPSPEDVTLTCRLREAGELLGIKVIDHVIVGDGCYRSFADDGKL